MSVRNLLFAGGLVTQCACAHAASTSSETAVTVPSRGHTAVQLPGAAQLGTSEVAALVDHLQSQHVYLKHLKNVHDAVQRELSIVQLMTECDRLGSACTGRGIVKMMIPHTSQGSGQDSSEPAAPRLPPSPPSRPTPPPAIDMPELVSVHNGVVSLVYQRRYVEVREGDRLGVFRVGEVRVDGVKMRGPRGTFFLSPRWKPSGPDRTPLPVHLPPDAMYPDAR